MNEKELGKALLRGQGGGMVDPLALTEGVLRRDRRRMWVVGLACIIAWMMVVMLPWATALPMLAKIAEHQRELEPNLPHAGDETLLMIQVRQSTIVTFILSIVSMFVAAVCTVLLILLSRRATLRQVNARLAEIAAQLKTQAGNAHQGG